MRIVHLVGGARNPQRVLRHLCMVILDHRPNADVHEPSVPEEPVVVVGVPVTLR